MATRKKPRTRTRTSAFGTAGRINHDASAFYGGAMYSGIPAEKDEEFVETGLPASLRNRIFAHSSEDMHHLPDHCRGGQQKHDPAIDQDPPRMRVKPRAHQARRVEMSVMPRVLSTLASMSEAFRFATAYISAGLA